MAEKNTKPTEKKALPPKKLTPAENEHNHNSADSTKENDLTSSADDKAKNRTADNVTQATNSQEKKEEKRTMDNADKSPQTNDHVSTEKTVEKTVEKPVEKSVEKKPENNPPSQPVVVKKGGSGLAVLAILIALGLGGAGYYFGQQQVVQMQQKMTALEQQVSGKAPNAPLDLPDFSQEREQLSQLLTFQKNAQQEIAQLTQTVAGKNQEIDGVKAQIGQLASATKAEQPNDWLLSETDFLLNNALRKLVLDNDIDTAVSLLKVADETLAKVSDPKAGAVRSAINNDLKQLLSLNNVDQNAVMQRLSQLANTIDELTVLNVNFDDPNNSDQLSDSIDDWKQNAEKSATSFLNHFIRITPRGTETKALLAPNQDIYLRENIRLRLQIAILAVPRQQNELYKQSLETVASWIRTYFDTTTNVAEQFLKSLDELSEQSIYVDTPNQLSSLNTLDKLLNKQPSEVQKIELSVDKALTEANAPDAAATDANAPSESNTAPQSSTPNEVAPSETDTPTNTEQPANNEPQQ